MLTQTEMRSPRRASHRPNERLLGRHAEKLRAPSPPASSETASLPQRVTEAPGHTRRLTSTGGRGGPHHHLQPRQPRQLRHLHPNLRQRRRDAHPITDLRQRRNLSDLLVQQPGRSNLDRRRKLQLRPSQPPNPSIVRQPRHPRHPRGRRLSQFGHQIRRNGVGLGRRHQRPTRQRAHHQQQRPGPGDRLERDRSHRRRLLPQPCGQIGWDRVDLG